mmetsp:Transcript_17516/g.25563  ORF Transcript_17516/g.25563 Transcript_17516/m.25563 type:complete len:207 (+) Transcript_17516:1321-1941(+)
MCDPMRCALPTTQAPTKSPTLAPTFAPTKIPTPAPTSSPTFAPTKSPTQAPTDSSPCGCAQCTDGILKTMAGGHTCGGRINWLQTTGGGSYSEEAACIKIARDEFDGICGPMCDPNRCALPTTLAPTKYPTPAPPPAPTAPPPCGCVKCTDTVLKTMAGDHMCGDRINWLQSTAGGSYSEEAACIKISRDEFDGVCGPMCDPTRCA